VEVACRPLPLPLLHWSFGPICSQHCALPDGDGTIVYCQFQSDEPPYVPPPILSTVCSLGAMGLFRLLEDGPRWGLPHQVHPLRRLSFVRSPGFNKRNSPFSTSYCVDTSLGPIRLCIKAVLPGWILAAFGTYSVERTLTDCSCICRDARHHPSFQNTSSGTHQCSFPCVPPIQKEFLG